MRRRIATEAGRGQKEKQTRDKEDINVSTMDYIFLLVQAAPVEPTDDEEGDETDDEERGAADDHATCQSDEGRQQDGGPEQEVEQRPRAAPGDDCGSRELSFLVVLLL